MERRSSGSSSANKRKRSKVEIECQVSERRSRLVLGLRQDDDSSRLTREQFAQTLQKLDFQWPLKPYGVDKNLEKTVMMNKGAETRLYMQELQAAGLYDPTIL